MFQKIRLSLVVFFTIVFLVITPLLILYAKDYHFDFNRHRLVKGGNLFIDSQPRDASVIINNAVVKQPWYNSLLFYKDIFGLVKRQGTTTSLVNNLLPGEYSVMIKKDGFQSWQKKINIESGETTLVKTIQLFLEQPKLEVIDESSISKNWPSPSRTKVIYTVQTINPVNKSLIWQVKLFDVVKEKLSTFDELKGVGEIIDVLWSDGENNLLISAKPTGAQALKYFVFNSTEKKLIQLNKAFPKFVFPVAKDQTNLKWLGDSSDIILVNTKNTLYSLNFALGNTELFFELPSGRIKDWQIDGQYINILNLTDQGLFFEKYKLKNNLKAEKTTPILTVDLPDHFFKFLALSKSKDFDFLINQEGSELIVLQYDLFTNSITQIVLKSKGVLSFKNADKLFYWNDYELWILNPVKTSDEQISMLNQEIITRLSQPITLGLIHPSEDYLIYVTRADSPIKEDQIRIVELAGPSEYNNYLIFPTKKISNLFWSNDPAYLYFIGESGDKTGLFKLQIQ